VCSLACEQTQQCTQCRPGASLLHHHPQTLGLRLDHCQLLCGVLFYGSSVVCRVCCWCNKLHKLPQTCNMQPTIQPRSASRAFKLPLLQQNQNKPKQVIMNETPAYSFPKHTSGVLTPCAHPCRSQLMPQLLAKFMLNHQPSCCHDPAAVPSSCLSPKPPAAPNPQFKQLPYHQQLVSPPMPQHSPAASVPL
jgi:hypothetical protein